MAGYENGIFAGRIQCGQFVAVYGDAMEHLLEIPVVSNAGFGGLRSSLKSQMS